jgi:phosphate transport system substrate-binding protein
MLNQKSQMMKMKLTERRNAIGAFILLALLSFACNTNPAAVMNDETPTRGRITIGADESFTLLTDAEIQVFESIYTYSDITPQYKPELDILNDFLNDSIQVMITCRKLSKEDDDYLKSKQIYPRTTSIAHDAVAFIINRKNKDSLFRYDSFKKIFSGKINNWSQLSSSNGAGKIKVVFDNNKSANVRYLKEKLQLTDSLPKYCYAVNNNEEVINYVEKNINAIGIVSVNWISDKDDSVSHSFLKVVAVTGEYDSDGIDYYMPHPAYIANKSYPFIREVYMISRETYTGLGSGLIAFVASDIGQRIVLKMGMVPSTMPIRLIQTKSNL